MTTPTCNSAQRCVLDQGYVETAGVLRNETARPLFGALLGFVVWLCPCQRSPLENLHTDKAAHKTTIGGKKR